MPQPMRHAPRLQTGIRGVSLIEALVAMAVMAFGMLALVGVQSTLRFNGDVAKQRSEATRIAERKLEELRSFKDYAAWNALAEELGQEVAFDDGGTSNARYFVNSRVVTPAGSPQKVFSVEVTWKDRLGNDQSVVLGDTLARAAPVLSALATMPAARTSATQNKNRHPTIPPRAHDMGNGESVFKPVEGGTVAWTFNNTTGVITSVCLVTVGTTSATLTSGDVVVGSNCTATHAQLLAGHVRFNLRGTSTNLGATSTFKPIAGGSVVFEVDHAQRRIVRNCINGSCSAVATANPVVAPFDPDTVFEATYGLQASDSENPTWPALPLGVSVGITSSDRPATSDQCFSDADPPFSTLSAIAKSAVEYFCIIYPDTSAAVTKLWSGKPVILPGSFSDDPAPANWAVGTDANISYRVCRYTKASNDAVVIANTDHPASYLNVSGNLINQNFLIIAGQKSCPIDVAVNPSAGDFVNSNTLQHQP